MFTDKLQQKIAQHNFENPQVYDFSISVNTKVSVFDLSVAINADEIVKIIYQTKEQFGGTNPSSIPYSEHKDVIMSWHSGWTLHKQTNLLDKLISVVEDKVHDCLGRSEERLVKVAECWSMIQGKGDRIVNHKHWNEGYSAVYYAKTSNNPNPLIFDRGPTIVPKTNMLICFPGYLHHHVPLIENEQERILISFNLNCIAITDKLYEQNQSMKRG